MNRYDIKYKSRVKYATALTSGKLIRKPCQECGNEKSQGHHIDYEKPYNVIWLCTKHHTAWHTKHNKVGWLPRFVIRFPHHEWRMLERLSDHYECSPEEFLSLLIESKYKLDYEKMSRKIVKQMFRRSVSA